MSTRPGAAAAGARRPSAPGAATAPGAGPGLPRLGSRGAAGRGGGRVSHVPLPPEWRATTSQVSGAFTQFAAAGASPTVGVPLGRNLLTGAPVCCDPLSWFTRARLIANPSAAVLGLPALGKSTLIRRMVIGLAGGGVVPLVLGDLKPDYADVVRALGGQVVRLGRGLGSLNVLDAGALGAAAQRLGGAAGARLAEEAHGRRTAVVEALVTLVRGVRPSDTERAVLSAGLRVLAQRGPATPLLADLLRVLEQGPEPVRLPTLDRGDRLRYQAAVDPLQRSLLSLLDGPLGAVFATPTSEPLHLDAAAVCVDVSGVSAGDSVLQAAVLLACWAEGFGAVEAANALADAGAGPQRRFLIVLDELWRVLRSGSGMVDRVDELTRLNRSAGVGQVLVTHSLADLRALRDPEDRAKARGFVERAGLVACGGLPAQELDELGEVVRFTRAERRVVTSWSTPPGWDIAATPPGLGKFLLKCGQRPGIPVQVELTAAETSSGLHDTNRRWQP